MPAVIEAIKNISLTSTNVGTTPTKPLLKKPKKSQKDVSSPWFDGQHVISILRSMPEKPIRSVAPSWLQHWTNLSV
ncbi:uncharacterized protein ARMOST_20662 [Armillaria ostoyae]|uniref:Uncharacterized protein n=1 Tax=Armillaria ostoyae TaxID=47428 RepID=A0A284S827_ARMOS|nr:uncharacterized protein ARMOST_20662 [Armillaria ostoyae]